MKIAKRIWVMRMKNFSIILFPLLHSPAMKAPPWHMDLWEALCETPWSLCPQQLQGKKIGCFKRLLTVHGRCRWPISRSKPSTTRSKTCKDRSIQVPHHFLKQSLHMLRALIKSDPLIMWLKHQKNLPLMNLRKFLHWGRKRTTHPLSRNVEDRHRWALTRQMKKKAVLLSKTLYLHQIPWLLRIRRAAHRITRLRRREKDGNRLWSLRPSVPVRLSN